MTLASLNVVDRIRLSRAGASLQVKFLGSRDHEGFYIANALTRGLCYLTGELPRPNTDASHFVSLSCPTTAPFSFPSSADPVYDESELLYGHGDRHPLIKTLTGFAADSIAQVGIRDTANRIGHWVPVKKNIYAEPIKPARALGLVARDKAGRIVWTYTFLVLSKIS